MEEIFKVAYTKNMNKLSFNTTITIPIDSNASIKRIINVQTYLYDQKVECGNGKAIISGKIGAKVLYLDTDNITNTVADNTSFSETYLDNSISSETYLNIFNSNIANNILSTEGNLKINCDVNMFPMAYINLPISNNINENEMLITKKSEILTNTIQKLVNTKFEHTSNLESNDEILKILCNNSYLACEKISAENGYAIVEGKIISTVLYEATNQNETYFKELKEVTNFKQDVEIENLKKDDDLDLSLILDPSCVEISTDTEDNKTIVSITNTIKVCGVVLRNINMEIVDDLYSVENDIETTKTAREYTKQSHPTSISEVVSNEVSLLDDEPAIDDILANLNITPEITNTYIKDNQIFVEGIIGSNLTYIDENKEYKSKQLEVPFVINTKIETSTLGCVHSTISIVDTKLKIKRGTIIEIDYSLFVNLSVYEKETHEIIDGFTIGKPLDFSKYDFQIFIAKQGESMWDLCKRIKISPNEIHKHNKNLPMIMEGGEKIIIKR